MTDLFVDCIDDTVSLTRGVNVDPDKWKLALKWWELEYRDFANVWTAELQLVDFAGKVQWLRTHWSAMNYSWELSERFQVAFQALRQQRNDFELIAFGNDNAVFPEWLRGHLKRPLTVFQEQNVAQLIAMKNGANYSVPGAGKTTTTIAVWKALECVGTLSQMLVVCPRSAFRAWLDEPGVTLVNPMRAQVFDNSPIEPETNLLIVNYEQLESAEKLTRLTTWMRRASTQLVLDEAHRVKGGVASVRWRATNRMSQNAYRVDILTGTPMPQAYDDLRNLFALTWRGIPTGYFSDALLKSLPRGGAFVRTTKDELNLPPVKYHPVHVPMGKIQSQIYSALKRNYSGLFRLGVDDETTLGKRGRAVFALIGAATNPGLLMGSEYEDAFMGLRWPPREISENAELMRVVANYASHEIPPKYEWIIRFLEESRSSGKKVLVWSNLVGNLRALGRLLQPFNPAIIHGGVSPADRDSEIQRFRDDPNCTVLITNPQTLGEGISLHDCCHDAVYVDRSYNAGHYLQSLDRIHRLGLAPDVVTNIYLLESEGTIDEQVFSRLEVKVSRLAEAMGDRGLVRASLPDDLEWTSFIEDSADEEDLKSLYDHLSNGN